jgi:hypothetical protein
MKHFATICNPLGMQNMDVIGGIISDSIGYNMSRTNYDLILTLKL